MFNILFSAHPRYYQIALCLYAWQPVKSQGIDLRRGHAAKSIRRFKHKRSLEFIALSETGTYILQCVGGGGMNKK